VSRSSAGLGPASRTTGPHWSPRRPKWSSEAGPGHRSLDLQRAGSRAEIRVRQGDLVEATLVNKDIDEGVTIHWHGLDVPNAEDGVAGVTQDAVMPGERHVYRFRADQLGTFWYHSHQISSRQVRRGLYGAFVIAPRQQPRLRTLDLTIIAHDYSGATVLGSHAGRQRRPVLPGTPVRLRLVNSNSFPERFHFAGTAFRVAAIDGTDLNGPTPIVGKPLLLGTGARYDITFVMPHYSVGLRLDATTTALVLVSDPDDPSSARRNPRKATTFDRRLRPPETDAPRLNHALRPQLRPEDQQEGRIHERSTRLPLGDQREPVPEDADVHGLPRRPREIQDRQRHQLGASDAPTRPPRPGPEPRRQADHRSPWWVDTLNVEGHEEYEVAFRADNPGIWMDHCHNLPHARDGLTMHLAYEGVTTPFRLGDGPENHPE
jgi:FtsP/CotA-like multicopper oxidase with cupredoxin domain